jgi:hypothetical protein
MEKVSKLEDKLYFNVLNGKVELSSENPKEEDGMVRIYNMPKQSCKKCHGTGRYTFYYNSLGQKIANPCKCLFKYKPKDEKPPLNKYYSFLIDCIK